MNESSNSDNLKLTANVKAGGCAAKLGSAELQAILAKVPVLQSPQLIAGIKGFEDAAVYKISEDLAIVQTIDFFPPLLDDPFLYGQIAAANALSDVYAMGGKPIIALNVLCFPTCDFPDTVLEEILRGGAEKVKESGASLAGGHSIQTSEPVYGLSVTGLVSPKLMFTNSGAKSGDKLVLTKALGTGISLLGLKGGELSKAAESQLIGNLVSLNDRALSIAQKYKVNAMTDITGFGLVGHVREMALSSGLRAELNVNGIEVLDDALDLAREGFVPAGAYGNRQSFEESVKFDQSIELEWQDLLFDPQTSGGLLISLPQSESANLLADFNKASITACTIGTLFSESKDMSKGSVKVIH